MAPQQEESVSLEDKRKELVALFKEDKWQEILSIYKRDGEKSDNDVWDCGLLWLRPSEKALNFIGENLKSLGLKKLLSIGCGSGLLEWLIQRATGIHVEGIEVDSLWWYSRYAPPCFLSKKQRHLIVVGDCLDEYIPKDVALLFCYFNNEHAFQEYMSCYLGNCLIVAGPASIHDAFPSKELLEGTDVEIAYGGRHCYPRPFNIMEPWVLKAAHAVTTSPGDYIAVYTR